MGCAAGRPLGLPAFALCRLHRADRFCVFGFPPQLVGQVRRCGGVVTRKIAVRPAPAFVRPARDALVFPGELVQRSVIPPAWSNFARARYVCAPALLPSAPPGERNSKQGSVPTYGHRPLSTVSLARQNSPRVKAKPLRRRRETPALTRYRLFLP